MDPFVPELGLPWERVRSWERHLPEAEAIPEGAESGQPSKSWGSKSFTKGVGYLNAHHTQGITRGLAPDNCSWLKTLTHLLIHSKLKVDGAKSGSPLVWVVGVLRRASW